MSKYINETRASMPPKLAKKRDAGGLDARRQAFLDQMAKIEKPIERVTQVDGQKGPIGELFTLPNRQTVRVRTNASRELMTATKGAKVDIDAPMTIEDGADFIGVAIPAAPGREGIDCYLIPTVRACADLRDGYRDWWAARPQSPGSRLRVIAFDDDLQTPGRGFTLKYEKFLIGNIETVNAVAPALADTATDIPGIIREHRRQIAKQIGMPEEAVSITITFS